MTITKNPDAAAEAAYYKQKIKRYKEKREEAKTKRDKIQQRAKEKGPASYEAEIGLPVAKSEINTITRKIATYTARLKITKKRK